MEAMIEKFSDEELIKKINEGVKIKVGDRIIGKTAGNYYYIARGRNISASLAFVKKILRDF